MFSSLSIAKARKLIARPGSITVLTAEASGYLDGILGRDPREHERFPKEYEEGYLHGLQILGWAQERGIDAEQYNRQFRFRWTCPACGEMENGNTDEHCFMCGTRITCNLAGGHSWTEGDKFCNRGTCRVPG